MPRVHIRTQLGTSHTQWQPSPVTSSRGGSSSSRAEQLQHASSSWQGSQGGEALRALPGLARELLGRVAEAAGDWQALQHQAQQAQQRCTLAEQKEMPWCYSWRGCSCSSWRQVQSGTSGASAAWRLRPSGNCWQGRGGWQRSSGARLQWTV